MGNDTHRILQVSEFRGFVLADNMAPLVFINDTDADTAKCFTLFHELVHLALAETGVVSPNEDNMPNMPAEGIESLCNVTAAELMVPEQVLRSIWSKPTEDLYSYVKRIASKFKASVPVVVIRAKELGLLTLKEVDSIRARYAQETEGCESAQTSGGDFYATKRVELGQVFSESIDVGVRAGRLSYTEAFQLTGLNRKTFDAFFEVDR